MSTTSTDLGLRDLWSPAVADDPARARVLTEQTKLLVLQSATSVKSVAAAAAVVGVPISAIAGLPACLLWIAVLLGVNGLRQRVMGQAHASGSLSRVLRVSLVASGVQAVILAAPCALYFPLASESVRALLTMLYVVWATAAMSVLGVFPAIYRVYLSLVLAVICAGWWLSPGDINTKLVVSAAMPPLWYALARFSGRVGRLVADSVNIRHEHERLVQRLEEALAETQLAHEARSRFLASASHDLLQPVHAMLLLTGLSRDMPDGPRRNEVLQQVHTTAEAIESMFRGLLDLARHEVGTLRPERVALRVDQVLQSLRAAYEARCAAKGIALCVEPVPPLTVLADAAMLERILHNLVDNAIKFTPTGSVTVRAGEERGQVRFEVADTGVGIEADELATVRQAFYRGSAARSLHAAGLGLGLANSTQMAELLGGAITIESQPGRGSTVSLSLPSTAAPSPQPQSLPLSSPSPLQYRHVALVEDDPGTQRATLLWLQEHGAQVVAGVDALEVQRQFERDGVAPDFLLCDYHLGAGGNGLQAIAQLRQRFGPLPAALVTGEPLETDALPSDITVLRKPLRSERLRVLLQQVEAVAAG